MTQTLHLLPDRAGSAAENMAVDFLLLQRYPAEIHPRFRHYGWHRPSFTFGYSQKIEFIRGQIPGDEPIDLCRRATGGGLVDHRDDWTYALVIPRGHPLEERPATQSYRIVHEALATALRALGVAAVAKAAPDPDATSPAGVCFQRAEVHDVVNADTGLKIAGAAQKRNKHGLLFQGSVWRPAAGGVALDWDVFGQNFTTALAAALETEAETVPWPDLNDEEVTGLTDRYASAEWNEQR